MEFNAGKFPHNFSWCLLFLGLILANFCQFFIEEQDLLIKFMWPTSRGPANEWRRTSKQMKELLYYSLFRYGGTRTNDLKSIKLWPKDFKFCLGNYKILKPIISEKWSQTLYIFGQSVCCATLTCQFPNFVQSIHKCGAKWSNPS